MTSQTSTCLLQQTPGPCGARKKESAHSQQLMTGFLLVHLEFGFGQFPWVAKFYTRNEAHTLHWIIKARP